MTNRDIKKIIRQLKKHELSIMDVPEAVKYHKDIVAAERKFGLRKEGNRGFDVVHELFFVEEELLYDDFMGEVKSCNQRLTFDSIEEYYEYLDGDIYDCACYRFCDINQFGDFIVTKNIDVNRLRERETFLSETVDDIVLDISNEEIEAYDEVEKNKKLVKKWIKKFNDCTSGSELEAAVEKYNKSKLKGTVDVSFFFYCYIFQDNGI